MTNKEAIEELKKVDTLDMPARLCEAYYMSIKALEQEPCGNCISRQATLEAFGLSEKSRKYGGDHSGYDTLMKYEIQDVLEALPPVNPQEPKWIPVSERMPESCGMYIVTRKIYDCPDTAPIIMSDESWFDGQNTWHNDNRINHERGYLSDVIAWMPLPAPFDTQESEDKE